MCSCAARGHVVRGDEAAGQLCGTGVERQSEVEVHVSRLRYGALHG